MTVVVASAGRAGARPPVAQGARVLGRDAGARRRCAPPHASTTTNASAGRISSRARKAARAAASRSAACSVFCARPAEAGDGAIDGGAHRRSVRAALVPPGDVSVQRGVGRRFQAGAQRVQVVLVEAARSARREGRSRARLAEPALDVGQTGGKSCAAARRDIPWCTTATTRSRRSREEAGIQTVYHSSTCLGTAIILEIHKSWLTDAKPTCAGLSKWHIPRQNMKVRRRATKAPKMCENPGKV